MFIEPLELQTWFMGVFAGTPDIFLVIALIVIAGAASFFRMTGLIFILMVGMFLLIFSGIISSPLIILIAVIGGLAIGYWIARIFYQ